MSLFENTAHLAPVWARYTDVVVERAEGAYLYGTDGSRYLDFTCGIGVTNTGHCHPRVVEAIREQAGLLLHGQVNIVYHKPMLELVAALRRIVPSALDMFFFSNSGAEAVEASVKLARQVTGRPDVIAFVGGFHGRTYGAMALTSSKGKYREGSAPLPSGIHFAPYATCSSCRFKTSATECCGEPLRQLRHMLNTQTNGASVAAMIVEPVLGEGGYIPAPASFLQGLRAMCDEIGALLIVDEVQSGFGRTGRWWGHDHAGITPDIMVMAKGIASGMPLSGLAARREIMSQWQPGTHGGTYGGNALSCAAAVATIAAMQEEGMVENAARQGQNLMNALCGLKQRQPIISDVRGAGLMVGVELTNADGSPAAAATKKAIAACRERGLLLLTCGTYDNVVRFIPPLIVNDEQVIEAVSIFAESLGA
ncbi:MAG: aminotransferase class III-fold pyridoxal phosphate-dependent enzyme [Chloroflexaceae bacterium]|jgi:4-aminobutyrate aminotransferase|nr:aminotransferase class III-fold pyridoxal phosphate-dependent enzyme [Chloroflexaceae bacterium]